MGRYTLQLNTDARRAEAKRLVDMSPPEAFVTFQRNKRTIPQNSRLWALLSIVAVSQDWPEGSGVMRSAEDWKDIFGWALTETEYVPGLTGTPVPLAVRTSMMEKEEFGNLMTLIEAFCAERGIDLDAPSTPGKQAA